MQDQAQQQGAKVTQLKFPLIFSQRAVANFQTLISSIGWCGKQKSIVRELGRAQGKNNIQRKTFWRRLRVALFHVRLMPESGSVQPALDIRILYPSHSVVQSHFREEIRPLAPVLTVQTRQSDYHQAPCHRRGN